MAKVALLVGVSEYEPGLNPLPGAVKDVDAVRDVLLHPEMGGFAESDILLLKNPERQDVEMAIETLFSGRHKDDLVVLYFSGHGIKDDRGRLYLATRTTRKTTQGELIRSTAVSANSIHDRMSESRSRRQVVILDSCFSGAFAEGLSAKDDGTVDIREQLGGEGRVVLTSSSSTQYSFEEQGQDLSIYTRFLIEGIKSGEADRDEDEFISIDELHEYASQKVRELQPAMKPEIYAIREGFKIRLSKVAPGDPSQRYRKEVARFIHRGDISFVGRRTLDVLRSRLGLEAIEAKAIEDEVLEPYRKEFREKLQQYEQVFTELLERDETITEGDRHDLQNLQQILGLRNEDTMPIEAQITAQFKTHQQNLQAYEQAFGSAVWQEYPLSAVSCDRLRQMQQQLKLTAAEVGAIESRITAEVETYHQKLQEYERLFVSITQQEYPLSEASRASLRQQQQQLGLKDVEIAPIEAQITAQIETYHQKLQQYEQAYVNATQRKHYLNEVTCSQLQQTWQTLGLSKIDVETIESRITAQIEIHQQNLRQYEQEFSDATQQQYPLGQVKSHELQQRQKALNLADEDITSIKTRITAELEEHLQKIQQYEQVFTEAAQYEYPLSEATREEIQRFQQILELTNAEVTEIEKKVAQTLSCCELEIEDSSELKNSKNLLLNANSKDQTIDHNLSGSLSSSHSSVSHSSVIDISTKESSLHKNSSNSYARAEQSATIKFVVMVGKGVIVAVGLLGLFSYCTSELKRQRDQAINEDVVLAWARKAQQANRFGECASLMTARADWFTRAENKIASQALLNECQASLKKNATNIQELEQKLNSIIANPKPPVPELFISTLTPQQLSSLNALQIKFVEVASDRYLTDSKSTSAYGEWRGLCIGNDAAPGEEKNKCSPSLTTQINLYANLFADYQLVTSDGWILYKP